MFDTLLAAGASVLASEEHGAHQLELYGIPTYWFAIFGFLFFGILMFITVSFSGRGVVRAEHAAGHLSAEEEAAMLDYKNKHGRH